MTEWIHWEKITTETYFAIVRELGNKLSVFATISNLGPPHDPDRSYHFMTEWGFRDADFPLIKSDTVSDDSVEGGYVHKYYIAKIQKKDIFI